MTFSLKRMEFDLSKLLNTSDVHSQSPSFFVSDIHEEEQLNNAKEVNFEDSISDDGEKEEEQAQVIEVIPIEEKEQNISVVPKQRESEIIKQKVEEEKEEVYLVAPKKNVAIKHMSSNHHKRIELRKKLFRKLEEATIIDTTLTSISLRSIQGTVMFFAIFLTIAMKFGEIKYLAPIFILCFILFYLVHHYVLKEFIYLRNDFDAGWNFSLRLGGDIICQILLLVAAAFTYEIIKQNPSIHAKDAFITLIKNMLQWVAIVFFLLKRLHYIILREHVVAFLLQEDEAPMLFCPPESMALD